MPQRVVLIARSALLATLALPPVGCTGGSPEPGRDPAAREPVSIERDPAAPIQTDADAYRLRQTDPILFETEVPFRFRNPLADTIYVVNCRGLLAMSLERREQERWAPYWEPALPLCLSPPIVIEPGAEYRGTMEIVGALPGHATFPEFGSAEPDGVYRLRWRNLVLHYDDARQGFGEPVPEELTYSNAFRLEDPRRRQ
jgi:hypothetical protein